VSALDRAAGLDAADPLATYRDEFVLPDGVLAYLDGNSLGRPLRATLDRLPTFVGQEWGERLIRSWDEQWMDRPTVLGDAIARATLGAAPGQTVVADSTTVLLYKLLRAAVALAPERSEIVADTENFPTDRYLVDSVAAECGLTVRWVSPDPALGVTAADLEPVLSERTAVVLVSQVAYKSAYLADLPGLTALAHAHGALVLWDLCHSAGSVDFSLDEAEVDLAVGCSYKYLNGGPGAPAFGYVATRHQDALTQPITGWMGHATPFEMGPAYTPASGIRRLISGTPPILGMLPVEDMVALVERAGMPAVRAKSVALTAYAVELADELLGPLGVTLASPRDPARRGGHVTFEHPAMATVVARLWELGVVPDFRRPNGLRAGLSPLSTSFAEVAVALRQTRDVLAAR
jgi:kynureninase